MRVEQKSFSLEILPQPDDETCGPTCLHAVYGYYGNKIPLEQVVNEVARLEGGGTLAVLLGQHALELGFRATIFTYNLQVFDPTWFKAPNGYLLWKLRRQREAKSERKLKRVIDAYAAFLEAGGQVHFEDLNRALIHRYLDQVKPILTGLSATYLYSCSRELGSDYDDVRGEPAGHFVVLSKHSRETKKVLIADPLLPNPVSSTHQYEVHIDKVICSILLGTLTYDANLLIIEPRD